MSSKRRTAGPGKLAWTFGLLGLLVGAPVRAQVAPTVAGAAVVATATRVPFVKGVPTGQFLTDTIEIGRPFQYALSFWHPPGEDVFFPDTSRSFAPFRVRNVALFPTRTRGAGTPAASSLDSAVYTLVSFETAVAQPLQVPIKMVDGADSILFLATPDTVFLRSRLLPSVAPGTLTLVSETAIVPLRQQFNYPYLVLALLTLLAVLGVVYALFNRSIRRQWQLYQLDQQHVRFVRRFSELAQQINEVTAADVANQAIVRWKTYLERLERQPYASLTSRELTDRFGDDQITDALREADQMIYGGAFSEQSQAALRVLREVANRSYRTQRSLLNQKSLSNAEATPPDTDL